MDGNIAQMLQGVMSDPETMKKLMSVAKSLTSDPPAEPSGVQEEHHCTENSAQENEGEEKLEKTASLARGSGKLSGNNNERIALICALRPYLSPERQKTADSLIKMLKMLKLTDLGRLLG